jgi:hypothetical protein
MDSEKSQLRSGITSAFNKSLNEALQFAPQMPFNIENTVTPSQLIAVLKGEQGTPGLPAAVSAVKDDNNLIMLAVSPMERGELTLKRETTLGSVTTITHNFTVPAGQKWVLKNVSIANTGTMTITSTRTTIKIASGDDTVLARGTTNLEYNFPQPITLSEGFVVETRAVISAFTSGNLYSNLLVQVAKI